MRIAMIGPFGFHPNKTMQSRAFSLARALVVQGQQVAIFMPPWHTPAEADKQWEEDGVMIRYVPLRGGTAGITRQLVRETLAWQPDIVHCFKPKAYSGLAAWWLWRRQRNRVRLVMDTDDWEGAGGWNDKNPYSPTQKRFFAWQEQWGMRHNHGLTVASRTLQSLAWSVGVAAERVFYLPNGAGVSEKWEVKSEKWVVARERVRGELGVGERPLLLLYSRLFEFDTARLVDCLARVKTAVPDLAILSIGTGLFADDAAKLRQRFADANLLESVIDVGWVEPEQLPSYFAAADVGVYLMDDTLLNRTKCPVKLADMITAGLPVVGEAVGEVNSYVQNGRSGLLHPSGDVDGVSNGLIALLQDDALRQQMATAAQSHAAEFAWEKRAAQLLQIYGAA